MSNPAQVGLVPDVAARLIAHSSDAIVVADVDGRITLWNSGAEAMFGYPADEALGQTLDLIIPESLRSRHWDGYHRTMATGRTRYVDDLLAVPGIRRDGTRLSLEFRVTLLPGPDGNPEAIGAVIRDVTRRWHADRAAQHELARLRALVEGEDPSSAAGVRAADGDRQRESTEDQTDP